MCDLEPFSEIRSHINSAVRGYHVYESMWHAVVGDQLDCASFINYVGGQSICNCVISI